MEIPRAFPRPYSESEKFHHFALPGMTMRQYYKAHAMAGLLANQEGLMIIADTAKLKDVSSEKLLVCLTGVHADAQLKEDEENERGDDVQLPN